MKYAALAAALMFAMPALAEESSSKVLGMVKDKRPQAPITDLGKSFSDLVEEGWKPTGAVIAMEYVLMENSGSYAVCSLQIGGGLSMYPDSDATSIDSACYQITG